MIQDSYQLLSSYIVVTSEGKSILVDRKKCENWLKFNGRLDFSMYHSHTKYLGSMTIEEYWNMPYKEFILIDLIDYSKTIKL